MSTIEYEGNITTRDTVFEEKFEREMSFDSTLADYCDDISRIIRVDVKPVVKNKFIQRNTAVVGGIVAFTVIYVSEASKQLKSYNFTGDFENSFEISGHNDRSILSANAEVGALSCRLLNPRKLTAKITLDIVVKVKNANTLWLAPNIEGGENVEKLTDSFNNCVTIASEEKEFKVSEEINIPADKMPAGEIIYADITLVPTETRALYEKALVKMNAVFKCLYAPQNAKGEYQNISKTIELTQIVDMPGADEDFECVADAALCSLRTGVDNDSYGENRLISTDFTVRLNVEGYKNVPSQYVVDAFSPKFESKVVSVNKTIKSLSGVLENTFKLEDSMVLEENPLVKALDINGVGMVSDVNINGNLITVQGSAEMSVMAENSEGEIENLDCTLDFKQNLEADENLSNTAAQVKCTINDMDVKINSGKLTITLHMTLHCVLIDSNTHQVISAVEVDEQHPLYTQPGIQFYIYYPMKGESVWNIAKQYKIPKQKILQANDLEQENLSDKKVLIIPCK
ncbi:MAG: SPOCS domain-containing protein [Eubacteriales bacterium]